ncbi:uncharacterized protein GGS22DRAFT_125660 [Annulohypoxylon maeteangense]|uniref:uncharacterized protein n=1 Tax=Annulohypoxylon maeteangense TaxID=1927788 RepID=UPI002007F4A0|nr:uncharacterized protein GGS22DRAFT_125660 [Annulohypoxylon maeteangense]KAI0886194.1 hypothetical protein GGS22DRAFT_125660 [Annulohypoxylon maeteangense]
MAEEPTLPKLPAVAWDFETESFSNTRKRARNRGEPSAPPIFTNSSDPAVFSSDDDPQLENYTQGRHRKKRYIGSWFQQHLASTDSISGESVQPVPKANRTFERQFDSGVWMGSDISVDTDDDTILDIEMPTQSKLLQLRHARPVTTISPNEAAAREKIQAAIDSGIQSIDLSSSGIESLSNTTVSQLSMFDTVPIIEETSPFESRRPFLEVYLSNNPLIRAPGALFNLEHLTVLSLRSTLITELPPSIGNLRNLQTLNLSLTRLRHLPGELLDLLKYPSKLRTLNIHPNPFEQPDHIEPLITMGIEIKNPSRDKFTPFVDEALRIDHTRQMRFWLDKQDGIIDEPRPYLKKPRWAAAILARSLVQYSDSRGVVISKFRLLEPRPNVPLEQGSSSIRSIQTEDLCSPPAMPQSARNELASVANRGRVPSLFELALQSCMKSGQLHELPSLFPPNSPQSIIDVLGRLADQSEANANSGNLPCSLCGRRVAVPMTQWIEWCLVGDLVTDGVMRAEKPCIGQAQLVVPFIRRGCSWKCLPKVMTPGQTVPGMVRFSID